MDLRSCLKELPMDNRGTRILVVDDEKENLAFLAIALEEASIEIIHADSGSLALDLAVRFKPALILLDVNIPGMDGFEVFRHLQRNEVTRGIPVLFLVSWDAIEDAVRCFMAGGDDFIVKPFRKEEVLARVRTHLKRGLQQQVVETPSFLDGVITALDEGLEPRDARIELLMRQPQMKAEHQGVPGFIGRSPAVQAVLEEIDLLRQAHSISVLIVGESGTGKEGVARAIHFGGWRQKGPFVAVNCAAIPGDLAESSFFGHLRGAFTGAHEDHRGYFEQADGGTLFLDEIGDLSLPLQAKLLRTVETGLVMPLGSSKERPVDVRIVSATHRDLPSMIAQNRFREDLFFRLAGYSVALPPLRKRREDIPLLVNHFLELFSEQIGQAPPGVSRHALGMLVAHEFPGNVRELKNLVEYALVKSRGSLIMPEHLRFLKWRSGGDDPLYAQIPHRPGDSAGSCDRTVFEEKQILDYAGQHGSINNTACRDMLGVDLQRASYLLKKLHGKGLLVRQGERRWSRYRLASAI